MSSRYELSALAKADLLDVWDYVAEEFGVSIADRVVDEIVDAFDKLSEHPEMGQVKPEYVEAPFRCWVVGPSLIAYRPDVKPIQIARVVRAERDWRKLELPTR